MREYDCDAEYGFHTVKITLQRYGYVGHIVQCMGGACKGREVIDFSPEGR